jgi:hypothetical protein
MTNTYRTGTVSVSNGSAVVIGSGTAWAVSLVAGGLFSCGGYSVPIASVEDDTHLTLEYEWAGPNSAGAAYSILMENAGAASAVEANRLLAQVAREQWASLLVAGYDPQMTGDLAGRSAFDGRTKGSVYTITTETGPPTYYYKLSNTSGDWSDEKQVDGPAGDPGPPGSADIVGTSATSLTIDLGAKMFTTQANKGWGIGARLRASVTASPDANWMEGVVTAYSGSSLTISVDATNGAGTHAGWTINLAGQRGVGGARETLSATRTYYVSTTGSNSNNGLSAGAPFLTLQKAADEAHKLDCSVYDVNIQLVDGTYGGASIVRPLLGGGTLYIIGNNTTPANVVITSAITVQGGASVSVSGLRFVIAASYVNALTVTGGAKLTIGKVDFGPQDATADHISGNGVSEIVFTQDYTVSGGARRHLALSGAVFASGSNRTITLTGTPAFTEFCLVAAGAAIALWNPTFTGSATGKRYTINTGGVVNLYGKPTTFLPGDVAGTTASGGVYA